MKRDLGIIEIFYGSPWEWQERIDFTAFVAQSGFDFYIYGPKADGSLRKNWQYLYNSEEFARLRQLRDGAHKNGLRFGVALSPYALHENFSQENKVKLASKVRMLDDLGLDLLGLFFDDMRAPSKWSKSRSRWLTWCRLRRRLG